MDPEGWAVQARAPEDPYSLPGATAQTHVHAPVHPEPDAMRPTSTPQPISHVR